MLGTGLKETIRRRSLAAVAVDLASVGLWYPIKALVALALASAQPAWALPVLASQALLALSALELRRMGSSPRREGMGQLSVKLLVGIWGLILPLLTMAMISALIGTGFRGPHSQASWGAVASIVSLLLSAVYPALLVWAVVRPREAARPPAWSEEARVARIELLTAVAVNLHLMLVGAWLACTTRPGRVGQLIAGYLVACVPRYTILTYRWRPIAAATVTLSVVWHVVRTLLDAG